MGDVREEGIPSKGGYFIYLWGDQPCRPIRRDNEMLCTSKIGRGQLVGVASRMQTLRRPRCQ